ncbi:unnamed protein product [Microthlaspi erraticum]|uniref:Pentatricopeptide repeat-containing protein n=1 Tax=Microthlaspi erraticum TaxID=1685480 RepID=A0A6D2L6M9_9BRAS|nr:unnamed protein product [Microthlaspi erraticum]CAA7060506.1 unnamed protein product [Microthlaspi erraticum]
MGIWRRRNRCLMLCLADIVSWNAMIKGFIQNDVLEEAKVLFESMSEKIVVTWTSIMCGYCRYGDVDEAYRLFCEMPERNVVSWTAMISGFAWNEFYREAWCWCWCCFHRLGQKVHAQVLFNGWESVDHDGRLARSLCSYVCIVWFDCFSAVSVRQEL